MKKLSKTTKRPSSPKFPVGARVKLSVFPGDERQGVVLSSGQDLFGPYREIQYDGGVIGRAHPKNLRALKGK